VELITKSFEFIKNDKDSVMFCFGGIGTTPDDLTREISAKVFTAKPTQRHEEFEKDILEKFGDEAYPHKIHMSDLPQNSKLLFNPVNNMSGYSLESRFFFVPGFPEMAHPMIENVVQTLFCHSKEKFRRTLLAKTSENTLISIMNSLPKEIELSSLPMFNNGVAMVELSLSGYDKKQLQKSFELFRLELNGKKIEYELT